METITQRQLRNDNAAVIERVEQGERLLVTKRGKPVAVVMPYVGDDFEKMVIRYADPNAALPSRVQHEGNQSIEEPVQRETVQEALEYLRGE